MDPQSSFSVLKARHGEWSLNPECASILDLLGDESFTLDQEVTAYGSAKRTVGFVR